MIKVCALGGEYSDFRRNISKENKRVVSLIRDTMEDALLKVGLQLSDLTELKEDNKIGVFVGNFDGEQYLNQGHLGALMTEIDPFFFGIPSARYEAACASSSVAIDSASSKIRCGDFDFAIIVGIELMKTVDSIICGDYLGTAAYYEKEAKGISFPFPKLFASLADQYIKCYSIGEKRYMDCLTEISVKNYSNAKRNPKAQTRSWFMDRSQASMRDTPTNPLVGGRLAVSDCSQVTDGCAVLFLCSEEWAKKYRKSKNLQIKDTPYLKGWGCRVAPFQFKNKLLDRDKTGSQFIIPWTRQAIVDALNIAKMRIDDVDVIETHDCFTSSEYAAISAFGITKPGEEYQAIESGKTTINGRFPINPSGGLIGVGHPVGASGARMLIDLWKQVSCNAGDYQIDNSKNGIMLNLGGSATTNYSFILGI